MDGQIEGARDLILAVFRLAVADFLGASYNHDGSGPTRRVKLRFRADADAFLRSQWGAWLGDRIGVRASAICAEAERLDAEACQVSNTAA
jgi:hypothetical protein